MHWRKFAPIGKERVNIEERHLVDIGRTKAAGRHQPRINEVEIYADGSSLAIASASASPKEAWAPDRISMNPPSRKTLVIAAATSDAVASMSARLLAASAWSRDSAIETMAMAAATLAFVSCVAIKMGSII